MTGGICSHRDAAPCPGNVTSNPVTEEREAIKALANSWSSGSRHAVGVESLEMEEEGGGKGGRQGKSGKASVE